MRNKPKKLRRVDIGRIIKAATIYYVFLEIADIVFNDKEIQKSLKELRKVLGLRMKKVLK